MLNSQNTDELTDIVKLFNLQLKKKEIIRTDVLSELLDRVTNQMQKRLEVQSDSFSNKDLLDFFNSIQTSIAKHNSTDETNLPTIAIQNNVVINDNSKELSKDSRDRITDLIKELMNKEKIIDNEVVESKINENGDEQIGTDEQ